MLVNILLNCFPFTLKAKGFNKMFTSILALFFLLIIWFLFLYEVKRTIIGRGFAFAVVFYPIFELTEYLLVCLLIHLAPELPQIKLLPHLLDSFLIQIHYAFSNFSFCHIVLIDLL